MPTFLIYSNGVKRFHIEELSIDNVKQKITQVEQEYKAAIEKKKAEELAAQKAKEEAEAKRIAEEEAAEKKALEEAEAKRKAEEEAA